MNYVQDKIDSNPISIQYGAFMCDVKIQKTIDDVIESLFLDQKITSSERDLITIHVLKECLAKYQK